MTTQPQRHSLVWLTPTGWDAVQAANLGAVAGARDAMARWRAADWPLVATRRTADLPPGRTAVGLPLPPDACTGTKPRIACVVEAGGILRHSAALGLGAALTSVPTHWRATLAALYLEAEESGLCLRVFGSLAWQSITGMHYLHEASDIDLLCSPTSERELNVSIELLTRYALVLPLDGEIIFPRAAGVAWKEWCDVLSWPPRSPRRVLVKYVDGVELVSCDNLLASLTKP
ncbi:MAG: malonate decarboxylase holo-[acyl-carrier-protein] synthase [Burkholderiaceae bacterium]